MSLHPKVIDLTLDRVQRLLAALDNPQDRLPPVIHLAGTNGKGSTQAMIRAGMEGVGHVVHAYTSPHLAKFHERIRIAGTLISEQALTEKLDACYAANNGETITYFPEITLFDGPTITDSTHRFIYASNASRILDELNLDVFRILRICPPKVS